MTKELFTVREVARMLDISESALRGYCRQGLVSPKRDKMRNWRWFNKEEVETIKTLIQPR